MVIYICLFYILVEGGGFAGRLQGYLRDSEEGLNNKDSDPLAGGPGF